MSDPIGPDGLLEPPEFRTPRWFTLLIAVAAVLSVALALVVLT